MPPPSQPFQSGVRIKKRSVPTTPRRELEGFELQAVQRAADDEEEQGASSTGHASGDGSASSPMPPPRGSSLLERLVKEDRAEEASRPGSAQPQRPGASSRTGRDLSTLAEADTPPVSPPETEHDGTASLIAPQPRPRSSSRASARPRATTSSTPEPAAKAEAPSPTRLRQRQGSQKEDGGLLGSFLTRGRSHTVSSQRRGSGAPSAVDEDEAGRLALQEQHHDETSDHHDDGIVDYLDVVDPEVGVINHMSNIQSSIFLPNLSGLYDGRITHQLPRLNRFTSRTSVSGAGAMEEGRGPSPTAGRRGSGPAADQADTQAQAVPTAAEQRRPTMLSRVSSAALSVYKRKPVQAPQHIEPWEDMDEGERHELDQHVEHLLSRPQKIRRGFRGFSIWARTPIGFIMLCYGLAITGWGIAICLFIFHWTTVKNPHERRLWIEYCDQVLCALFAAVGLGFAPFRAVDTYRMIHIAHYHRLSWRRRREFNLPELNDPNDLPRPKGYNEAFPKPDERVMHLITEEGGHDAEERGPSPSSSTATTNSSASPQRQQTESPTKRFAPPPATLPQAISNAKAVNHKTRRRWWRPWVTASEKEERRHAVEAAAKAVDEAPPVSEALRRLQSKGPNADGGGGDGARPSTLTRNASIVSEIVKEKEEVVVLTPEEQEKLSHHQRKFHKSHGYYRFHQTATHRAFPLDLLIVIVCLLDCHSLLQGCLGGVTWGIRYEHRPTALTATLISCSLSCNAVAGFIIYLGGRRTKKKEEVERRLRIAIEEEAYKRIQAGVPLPLDRHGRSKPRDASERQGNSMIAPGMVGAAMERNRSRPTPIMEESTPSLTAASSRPSSSRMQATPAATPAATWDTKAPTMF